MNYLIILIKFKVSRFLCRSVYNEGYTFSFFQWLKKKTPAKRFEPGASSVRPGTPARETRRNLPFFFVNLRTFRRFLSGWWYGQSGQPPWFFFCSKRRRTSGDLSLWDSKIRQNHLVLTVRLNVNLIIQTIKNYFMIP
jgi:hypothetical protein